jgi:hypothetical protein
MPNGVKLRLYDQVESYLPVMGGGQRKVMLPVPKGDTVTLHGWRVRFGELPKCVLIDETTALTSGIDADWWAKWMEQNKTTDLVLNKQVFAHARDTNGLAREHKNIKSGLEPLNPEMVIKGDKRVHVDPRFPKGVERAETKS